MICWWKSMKKSLAFETTEEYVVHRAGGNRLPAFFHMKRQVAWTQAASSPDCRKTGGRWCGMERYAENQTAA